MDKFLFLDIDGVLNTTRSLFKIWAKYMHVYFNEDDFSEKYWDYADGVNPKLTNKIENARKTGKYKIPNTSLDNYPFDKICINNLNKIIHNNNPKIVICSSWRNGRSVIELQNILHNAGCVGKVFDKTGHSRDRGMEIYEWIINYEKKYNRYIKNICIIDDDHSFDIDYLFYDYTIKNISANRNGLRKEHIKESNRIFNLPFFIENIK